MKTTMFALLALAGATGAANAQAVQGFTGGTQFDSYWGGFVAADVVGWRFTVNEDVFVTDLGVWNQDAAVGLEGLTSDHQVGIWDLDTGTLLVSGVAGPSGTAIGAFTYTDVADTLLTTSGNYVIGAMYAANDGDSYITEASSVTMDSAINFGGGVFPDAADLGFVMPGQWSGGTSNGRFGPNFLFRPVPAPGALAMLGLGGLAAARRRR